MKVKINVLERHNTYENTRQHHPPKAKNRNMESLRLPSVLCASFCCLFTGWPTNRILTFHVLTPHGVATQHRSPLTSQTVLSMKTKLLLWLHTNFKWTAPQNQQDYGIWMEGKTAENSTSGVLCAHCLAACVLIWGLPRLAHIGLNPTHTSHMYLYVLIQHTTSTFLRLLLLRNIAWSLSMNMRLHTDRNNLFR